MRLAPTQEGLVLQALCAHQNEMHGRGGAPQSVKRVQVATAENVGPSQWGEEEPLFLESELEDGAKARTEMVGSEIPGNTATELMEALRAQMTAMQSQACIEEWLCTQMD